MEALTHNQLCDRAKRWLSGTKRCEPVLSNCASCREIPDAIGWSSCHKWYGSIVVECKTSWADFWADQRKYEGWRNKKWNYFTKRKPDPVRMNEYERVSFPKMGDFRFFMCEPGIIEPGNMKGCAHAVDHGLLYVIGRSVKVIVDAPRRQQPDYASEVRFLRFAIINGKTPFERLMELRRPQPIPLGPDDSQ